ncbi:MAG TPA: tetratricopeptide repeat protein [Terriglobia bacterium]|nr:tetratricopeptide repeat protein [Terriglobia bacterium]
MRVKFEREALCLVLLFCWVVGIGASWSFAEQPESPAALSNEELLGRAERSFLMRNFLAARRDYFELDQRLVKQLSALKPSEDNRQIEIEQELILAPFGLGHSLMYLHRYSEALEALERGIRTYPDWASNHTSLIFFQDPLFTGPVVSDLETLMKHSNDPTPWLLHGYIQFFGQNFDSALRSFSHVSQIQPGNFMADYFLQQIRQAAKESPDPEKINEDEAEKLSVDDLVKQGSAFFKKADYQMAARLFKTAIDKKQDAPVVHIAYGDSLFALGKFGEATQAIVKGLEIYPKYAESHINRRDFYGDPSDFDSQLQTLEAYVSKNPADHNARFLLGYNYFFIQDYDRADEQLQAVLTNRYLQSSARYLHNLIHKYQSQKTHKPL